MSSKVIVNMRTCSHVHEVTVSMREDGNLDVDIVSDCPNIQEYARRLKVITMDDATNFAGSKIVDPEVRAPVSAGCLCPIGVFNAAWKELGMMSGTICQRAHTNDIVLDPPE